MGLFDAIKKAFDAGGIKVKLDVPKSFKWSDGSIPATVTLIGHKAETRIVENLRFTLTERVENEDGSRNLAGGGAKLSINRSEPIELQPLQELTVEVVFPLPTAGEQGSVTAAAGKIMDLKGRFGHDAQWYTLAVHTTVGGAKARKSASRRIRNSAASMGITFSFGS